MDLAAAHAHRVDHGHAACRDIVAVAHAAGGLPGDRLAEVGAGFLHQLEQRFGLFRQRLGRTAEAAAGLDFHVMLGGDGGDDFVDLALRHRLDVRRPRAQVDAQDGEVGNDVARAAALDPRGVHAQPVALEPVEPQREVGGGEQRVAPVLGVAPGVRRAAVHDDGEIAASRPGAGERPVGQRRRLIGQRGALALRGLGEQRGRAERADLLVAVDHDLVTDPVGGRASLDRLQRGEHDRQAALHVGDAGAVEAPSSSQRVC